MTNEQEVLELAKQHGAVVGVKHILDVPKEGIFFSGADELSAFAQAIRDQEAEKVAERERQLAELDAENDTLTNDFWALGKRCADYRKRAEQAEQRIAESQRPQYGFVPEFLRFTQRPCGCHYAEYELQLTDCGGGFSGKAPNLYCAPIIPPTVEEAVKAGREAFRCGHVGENNINLKRKI